MFFYACCLVGILICRKLRILESERRFLLSVLVMTFLNCFFVSFGVYAINRYMFYNLPLLYIGAEICAFALIRCIAEGKKTCGEVSEQIT